MIYNTCAVEHLEVWIGRIQLNSAATEGEEKRAVLQYGKCAKSTFVMDIRRPMSLVQV